MSLETMTIPRDRTSQAEESSSKLVRVKPKDADQPRWESRDYYV
jgi:hypothetical protein